MTGETVHAFDVGYRRTISDVTHLSVNYQHKSAPTFSDDKVNTRVQVTLGVAF